MTVNPLDVLRVSARQTYNNSINDIVGVYHYRSEGPAETEATTLLNLAVVIEALYIAINARVGAGVVYEEVTVQNITQDVVLGNTPWPTLTFGILAAQQLPSPVAALVVGVTGVPQVQGRKYLGGFTEDDQNVSIVSGTLLTALANFGVQYIAQKVVGGVTYTPFVRQVALPNALHPLIGAKAIAVFRTQRRRTLGRGS